jgi:hypothetical protein
MFPGGFFIKIIIHIDDKLFFGNNEIILTEFKEKIPKRFDVKFLGQTHWYLSAQNSSGCRIQCEEVQDAL